jgi:aminoglycoside/choline kinase family phosphotransferase
MIKEVNDPFLELILNHSPLKIALGATWGIDRLENIQIDLLAGGGSDRCFYRIHSGTKTAIVLLAPQNKDENQSYQYIGNYLASHGVPVPAIHYSDTESGIFLIEDLGDVSLFRAVTQILGLDEKKRIYQDALEQLANMQIAAAPGFNEYRCFATPYYTRALVEEWEIGYFIRCFLQTYFLPTPTWDQAEAELKAATAILEPPETRYLLHRDFQSQNLLISDGQIHFIDFQGLRRGPLYYDLASLLNDPYTALTAEFRENLEIYYFRLVKEQYGLTLEHSQYCTIALFRNLQVLGAYGFLGYHRGKKQYLKYIPPALITLKELAEQAMFNSLPAFRDLVRSLPVQTQWES